MEGGGGGTRSKQSRTHSRLFGSRREREREREREISRSSMCAVNRVPDLPGSTPVCQRRPFGVAYKTANLSQISKTNTADRHRFLSRFVPRFLRTRTKAPRAERSGAEQSRCARMRTWITNCRGLAWEDLIGTIREPFRDLASRPTSTRPRHARARNDQAARFGATDRKQDLLSPFADSKRKDFCPVGDRILFTRPGYRSGSSGHSAWRTATINDAPCPWSPSYGSIPRMPCFGYFLAFTGRAGDLHTLGLILPRTSVFGMHARVPEFRGLRNLAAPCAHYGHLCSFRRSPAALPELSRGDHSPRAALSLPHCANAAANFSGQL